MSIDRTRRAALLRQQASRRILLKDGPYGTMIQRHKLDEVGFRGGLERAFTHDQKGNNDLLNLSQPDIIGTICDAYLDAGADLVATNTFNANAISQADYGGENLVHDINAAAARIIRARADAYATDAKPRFVLGAVGPTNKTLSLSPDVNNPGYREVDFDRMKAVYGKQIAGLLDGGVDFILIETIFDTLNAKAAIMAALELEDERGHAVPLMLSLTITDLAGRNLSGQTPEAFWHSIRHARPLTVGLNCSFGARQLRPHLEVLAAAADTLIMAYPNAGLPNDLGDYDELPEETAALIADWADAGFINIVGGCCGSTPAHIAAIAKAVAGKPPRAVPHHDPAMRLSGLEAVTL
ncbi:MAG: 5-methyltetrahydrofolate--homocysteine methyltransferase [Alphaproteobacteria bacterium]|nr:MAG: 5-methyltetrahydrofolate--homocysteine methyltransferase [Alphaproteobacteria bacterium]